MSKTTKRTPATIIGGFLGAGKTTLLNRILQSDFDLKAAVLVNDFGSINIDSSLIKSNDGKVMNLANGCICCSISGDLVGQIESLLDMPEPPEYLLIEASGVSDPGRIARVLNYKIFRERIQVDAVLTLVDAEQFEVASSEFPELARVQLKTADIVVINKTDLCSEQQLSTFKSKWLLDGSTVFETCFADVPMQLILGTDANQGAITDTCSDATCQHKHHHQSHDDLFESISWQCVKPINIDKLKIAIKKLPAEIYRAKGIFIIEGETAQTAILQKVGSRTEWSFGDRQLKENSASKLVMISKKGKLQLAETLVEFERQL